MTTSNRTNHKHQIKNKTQRCRSENSAPLFYPQKIRRGEQCSLAFVRQHSFMINHTLTHRYQAVEDASPYRISTQKKGGQKPPF